MMEYDLEPDDDGFVSVDAIRQSLQDYYGTAMQQFPMAVVDLTNIDSMSDMEVIREAQKVGII